MLGLGASLAALALLIAHGMSSSQKKLKPIKNEDLLDLMVRIAESPEEWERVHRVLSQLGAENDFYYSNFEEVNPTSDTSEPLKNPSVTTNLRPMQGKLGKGDQNTYRKELFSTSTIRNEIFRAKVVDTGWPDFEETFGGLKKYQNTFEDNELPETDWFSDDWHEFENTDLEPSASSGLSLGLPMPEQKVNERSFPWIQRIIGMKSDLPSNDSWWGFQELNTPKSSRTHDKVSSVSKSNSFTNIASSNYLTERNRSMTSDIDRKIYNLTESIRSSRPEFRYHRVTSSPRRSGSGAFIAVSVAKQKLPEVPVSTGNSPRHRTEEQLTEINKKERTKKHHHHHQGKGRRRRTHSPTH